MTCRLCHALPTYRVLISLLFDEVPEREVHIASMGKGLVHELLTLQATAIAMWCTLAFLEGDDPPLYGAPLRTFIRPIPTCVLPRSQRHSWRNRSCGRALVLCTMNSNGPWIRPYMRLWLSGMSCSIS